MDLDNIKKTWQETEINPDIGKDKIQKMIDNDGQSAFNKLLFYEKIAILGLVICIPIGLGLFNKYLPVSIVYILSIIFGIVWQIYKYKSLQRINVAEMSITEVAASFYKYRKCILKEFYIGLVWFVAFFALFGYCEFIEDIELLSKHLFILVIGMIIGLIFVLIVYKKLYWKNIKKLEASIKEIEEFNQED
ncbi:MAG: hypothetical protein E6767_04525 [Dysgonomonas sp.]|nr:hypothetical protein [Dysgonomonas sp.]